MELWFMESLLRHQQDKKEKEAGLTTTRTGITHCKKRISR